MSISWQELFRLHQTTLKRSTAFHPQIDGQTEIANKALETYLRCFLIEQSYKWAGCVHWIEFYYNISPIRPYK